MLTAMDFLYFMQPKNRKLSMGHFYKLLCEEMISLLHKGKMMDWGTKSSFFPLNIPYRKI